MGKERCRPGKWRGARKETGREWHVGEVERHEMGGRGRAKLELLAVTQGECRTQEPPRGVGARGWRG